MKREQCPNFKFINKTNQDKFFKDAPKDASLNSELDINKLA